MIAEEQVVQSIVTKLAEQAALELQFNEGDLMQHRIGVVRQVLARLAHTCAEVAEDYSAMEDLAESVSADAVCADIAAAICAHVGVEPLVGLDERRVAHSKRPTPPGCPFHGTCMNQHASQALAGRPPAGPVPTLVRIVGNDGAVVTRTINVQYQPEVEDGKVVGLVARVA